MRVFRMVDEKLGKHPAKPTQCPSDVLAYVPVTTPWKATPPYAMPRPSAVAHRQLCERSHDVRKRGRCELCGLHRPKRGGWGQVCAGRRP